MAYNSDFDNNIVAEHSPNMDMHRHFFDHDLHVLLSSEPQDSTRTNWLENEIRKVFPKHKLEVRFLEVKDVLSIKEIHDKVGRVLAEFKDAEIDIFFSPGTSIMQLTWYMFHSSGVFKTRIIEGRPPKHSQSGKPEFFEEYFEKDDTPHNLLISEKSLVKGTGEYFISQSLESLYKQAEKVAAADGVTVLIRGETGTGKEHLARFIKDKSARKRNKYIAINCSAISDSLLESRLFGYVKGAFTQAVKDTKGFFEEYNGGTIFLDEIGDISPNMQQALLRVIQEGEIIPVGSVSPKKVNVRIIAATNRDLEELCREGKFRLDLYYRLIGLQLKLPSLIERGAEEVKNLAEYFLDKLSKRYGKSKLKLEKSAWDALLSHSFPGNIRELEQIINYLYVFSENTQVKRKDLPELLDPVATTETIFSLEDVKINHTAKVYRYYNSNKSKTCKALGISINTLKDYLKIAEERGALEDNVEKSP